MDFYAKPLVATIALLWVLLAAAQNAHAGVEMIEPFLGDYFGEVTFEEEGVEHRRDLSVSIKRTKEGFNITWKTTQYKPSGKVKTNTHDIDFVPTKRENVFSSAMRTNVFGGRSALDPMKGDPYVWSRITGDTLTVYALWVIDDGGYEMQVYDRTLAPEGLDLRFSRNRNGKNLRLIETLLRRT